MGLSRLRIESTDSELLTYVSGYTRLVPKQA